MDSESIAQTSVSVQPLERTLHECFQRVFRLMTSDKLGDLSGKTSALERLLDEIAFCEQRVDIEGMLSKNEELDDIQTSSLPVSRFMYFYTHIFINLDIDVYYFVNLIIDVTSYIYIYLLLSWYIYIYCIKPYYPYY